MTSDANMTSGTNVTSDAAADLTHGFVQFSREKLIGQFWPRLRTCVSSLSDEQIWWRPNAASNSIANLMLHLSGNVTQWLIVPFMNADDTRNRPAEFSRTEGVSRDELIATLGATMERAAEVLDSIGEADLRNRYPVQGYWVTGLEILYHVVEHFSEHYGQVVYITKMLCGEDLGFYRELDQTGRREPGSAKQALP